MEAYAAEAVARLTRAFAAHGDASAALKMAAYMRGQFPFLGISSPVRRALAREAFAGLPPPAEADLADAMCALWALPEREYQYTACDLGTRHIRRCGPQFLAVLQALLTAKPWWDTVDALAANAVGPLVLAHAALARVMDDWAGSDDLWLARSALLHQLRFRRSTDPQRLFRYCLLRAPDKEFFLRKAIGWALREYSKHDGPAVRAFVAAHAGELSALSRREALLWLERHA